ncbi:hypothetical protein [Candidatus Korarchaeum cryptofilum]|jgi:hypothetical protein|nr:hypothetical protein [Candidatus Korarchaeum cryptofilum]
MPGSNFYPLPLKNLYKLATSMRELDVNSIMALLKVSKRKAEQYEKTLNWILGRVKDAKSMDEFFERVAEALLSEYKLDKAFALLMDRSIPLSPSSLSSAIRGNGMNINDTEAKAIISWLKEGGFLKERRVPILALSLEERVLEDIRSRGSLTYSSLRKVYGDSARRIIFSLWKKGLVNVSSFEKYRKLLESVEDIDRIPGNVSGKVFSTWQDRISGEVYSELVIPLRERISARWH